MVMVLRPRLGALRLCIWFGTTIVLTFAQLDQLPACALQCATSSIASTGCQTTDFACICGSSQFIGSFSPCVLESCSGADIEETFQATRGLCAAAGIDIDLPVPAPALTNTESSSSLRPSSRSFPPPLGPSLLLPPSPSPSTTLSSLPGSPSELVSSPPPGSPSGSVSSPPGSPSEPASPRITTQSSISPPRTSSEVSETTSSPPASTTSSSAPISPGGSKLSTGAIVGIAVGIGVPLLAVFLYLGFRLGRRNDVPRPPVVDDAEGKQIGGIGPDNDAPGVIVPQRA